MAPKLFAPRHWSLQTKVILGIIAAQIALATTLLSVSISKIDNALVAHTRHLQSDIDLLLETNLVGPLKTRDYIGLQTAIDKMRNSQNIGGLRVIDADGTLLASSGNLGLLETSRSISDLQKINWSDEQAVSKTVQIKWQSVDLGSVTYSVSLAQQAASRKESIQQFALLIVLGTLATIAIASLLVSSTINRLKTLLFAAARGKEGDLAARVPVNSMDEIGQLAAAFNQMNESIAQQIADLIMAERQGAEYLADASNERARLSALLDSIRLGIVFLDNNGRLLYVNQAAQKIWRGEIPHLSVNPGDSHFDERDLADGRIICETCHPVYRSIDGTDPGEAKQLIGSVWTFEDVTEERKAQRTIRFLAERDSLTGLLNRRSFTESLERRIARQTSQQFALVYVDVDNFKIINDLHGHASGDQVLLQISNSLVGMTREADLVARMGGDEFVIMVEDIGFHDLTAWCERLLIQLTAEQLIGKDTLYKATCSIGVALYPRDADTATSLIAAADQAMFDAKSAGKNAWRQFVPQADRDKEKLQTILWADRINEALRGDGFEVFLQGVHRVQDRSLHHYEALIRLPDPNKPGEFFSPGLFIGQAERSGKIVELDRWMIQAVVKLLNKYPQLPPVAVNVSALTLTQPDFAEYVGRLLNSFSVNGTRLLLELTETAALSDLQSAKAMVRKLQSMGCSVCLDDFGAGFASLAYLKQVEANYLKIDGMFIQNIDSDRQNQVLLRAIVDIAKNSGRQTVAEWIESEDMLNRVAAFGVDLVQGYLLSRPRPAAEVVDNSLIGVV